MRDPILEYAIFESFFNVSWATGIFYSDYIPINELREALDNIDSPVSLKIMLTAKFSDANQEDLMEKTREFAETVERCSFFDGAEAISAVENMVHDVAALRNYRIEVPTAPNRRSALGDIANETALSAAGGACLAAAASPIFGVPLAGAAISGAVFGTRIGAVTSVTKAVSQVTGDIARDGAASDGRYSYQFGDLTKGLIARGKRSRGAESADGYRIGDIARGALSIIW